MTELEWGLPVVAKYVFGGLSMGAFVTYYLWQGFGLKTFRPLAKLAWISAAVFGLVIPIPIFSHLGQAGRWPELLLNFHWTSPMSWAAPILVVYLVSVLLNGRFFFHDDVVLAHRSAKGVRRIALRILLLTRPPEGQLPERSRFGLRITGGLAFLSVLFFGYTGLELGILGSHPLWANPINPAMFLITNVISGAAFVVLLWMGLEWPRRRAASAEEKAVLASPILPLLIGVFLGLNLFVYLTLSYAAPAVQDAVAVLETGALSLIFLWVGLVLGAAVPAMMLVGNARLTVPRASVAGAAAVLILIGSFAQKYGFVAGGQIATLAPGEVSPWPSTGQVVEFLAILALVYFLFQVALWLSPWRQMSPMPGDVSPAAEVTA